MEFVSTELDRAKSCYCKGVPKNNSGLIAPKIPPYCDDLKGCHSYVTNYRGGVVVNVFELVEISIASRHWSQPVRAAVGAPQNIGRVFSRQLVT